MSTKKSKVIYPNKNPVIIVDQYGSDVLTLDKVTQYRYLGINTFATRYKTGCEKQKHAILTAKKYKGACLNVSNRGPDTTELATKVWTTIAIPAILFGCESVPFSDTTVDTINRIQSQVFKSLLSLPISTHNILTQTEFGVPHFGNFLYKHQLNAVTRWLNLPTSRWASLAMYEHMSGNWKKLSPFWLYICKLKEKFNIHDLSDQKYVHKKIDQYYVNLLNKEIIRTKLPSLKPVKFLLKSVYVSEYYNSSLLVGIKYNNCPKIQCQGIDRQRRCPVCPPDQGENLPPLSSEYHVLWKCAAVNMQRRATGVSNFKLSCTLKNITDEHSFFMYVNGFDIDYKRVKISACMTRVNSLDIIRNVWLKQCVL